MRKEEASDMESFMNYEMWAKSVPICFTGDPLWRVEVYRLALFLADLGWHDVSKLIKDKRTIALSDQLYRALGSIAANISEGYSRGSGKDRVRFYEYALGSAREGRGWYYNGRHVLGDEVANHHMNLLSQIIRLLLVMIPDQRHDSLREDYPLYRVQAPIPEPEAKPGDLSGHLQEVPLP